MKRRIAKAIVFVWAVLIGLVFAALLLKAFLATLILVGFALFMFAGVWAAITLDDDA